MTTLPSMGIVLPTRGAPGSGLWADALDAALTLTDGHTHLPGSGVRITSAAININADLTFAGFAATHIGRLTFDSVTALAANNKSFFVSSADNELYWRSNAGTNVKLTSGAALNVAAFTGGIGGDYTAVSAAVTFDDAGDRYTFKQNAATGWARLACGDVRLFETGTSESVFVGLAAPAALAASFTVTMPLAAPAATTIVQMDSSGNLSVPLSPPGSTSMLQMSSAGVLSASNTVANAATFSTSISTPTIAGTPNFTGAVTMASTLGVTGLITATAGATAAANQHVTVSGTGVFKHGTRTLSIPVTDLVADTTTAVVYNISTSQGLRGNPDPIGRALCGIRLLVGQRITAIRVFIRDNVTGPTKLQATFNSVDAVTGTLSAAIATSALSSGAGTNQTLSMTGLTTTVAASTGYYVLVQTTTGTASDFIFGVEVDYDQP